MNDPNEHPTSVHFKLHDRSRGAMARYRELVVGEGVSLGKWLLYEILTGLFGSLPGAVGYFLRQSTYGWILGSLGRGVIIGRWVTFRHPSKIHIRDGVAINDLSVLDAFGGPDTRIEIGEESLISRNTVLNAKGGSIHVGRNTNLGMNCTVFARDCRVSLGDNILMAAYCYLMGGGNHGMDRTDIPIVEQTAPCEGITIEDNVWFGAGVKVMDGCSVGRDAVVGTNSFVNRDVPAFAIAGGVPAKVLRIRGKASSSDPTE